MKIIKRNGEEFVFDTSKIVKAVMKAVDLFAGVGGLINEIVEAVERSFYAALHSVAHMILHGFYSVGRKIKKALHCPSYVVMCLVSAISACVKILSLVSGYVSCKTRAMYLLRTQDRGSSDSEGDTAFVYIAA